MKRLLVLLLVITLALAGLAPLVGCDETSSTGTSPDTDGSSGIGVEQEQVVPVTTQEEPADEAAPVEQPATKPKVAAPKPEPAPEEPAPAVTVYVTKTGEKYHSAGCQYLSKSKIPIGLSDAKAQGYTACSRCGPPG